VAIEKALAEGRARAQEHRENRDIFLDEIRQSAAEWGKQYMILLQEVLSGAGTGVKFLLTTDYGPKAFYGVTALLVAYYGIRGGVGLSYRCGGCCFLLSFAESSGGCFLAEAAFWRRLLFVLLSFCFLLFCCFRICKVCAGFGDWHRQTALKWPHIIMLSWGAALKSANDTPENHTICLKVAHHIGWKLRLVVQAA
jgi:hypothetical protein